MKRPYISAYYIRWVCLYEANGNVGRARLLGIDKNLRYMDNTSMLCFLSMLPFFRLYDLRHGRKISSQTRVKQVFQVNPVKRRERESIYTLLHLNQKCQASLTLCLLDTPIIQFYAEDKKTLLLRNYCM